MSLIIECPQYIRKTIDVLSGDSIHISIRIGNSSAGYIVIYDGSAVQTLPITKSPGLNEFDYDVVNTGTLLIKILPVTGILNINEILICNKDIERCEDIKITNLRSFIELEGTPRQPINIFNGFLRITYKNNAGTRRIQNVRIKNVNKSSTIAPSDCTKPGLGDYWKSQLQESNVLNKQLTTAAINSARDNLIVSIANRDNWLWSIPASSKPISQDYLVLDYDIDEILGVVEKLEVFLLCNKISFTTPQERYAPCTSGFIKPDPAYDITVTTTYTRVRKNATTNKSFSILQDLNTLHNIVLSEDENPSDKWDTFSNYLYGIKGSAIDHNAKWMAFQFILDKDNGKGIDQCTSPTIPEDGTAYGTFVIPTPTMSAIGTYKSKCDASIEVQTVVEGSSTSAIDTFKLPQTYGGTYRLGYIVDGQEEYTDDIDYNASAETIRQKLADISFIGNKTHIQVTGLYNLDFVIFYKNKLAGYDPPTLIADAENLQGAAFYEVERVQSQTFNDIQIISKVPTTTQAFIIRIGGHNTASIRYNASLDDVKSAIESLEIVGSGNVKVSGSALSNTADYQGPWTIEFIGSLAGLPMPNIVIDQLGYIVDRYNTGGEAKYEQHAIRYRSSGGVFSLTFTDPDTGNIITIADIEYDITAEDLLDLIDNISWMPHITIELYQENDYREFIIEYIDDGTGLSTQQMPLPIMDGIGLIGGQVITSRIRTGSGTSEQTRLTLVNAKGGSFTITVNGNTTTSIPYNTTAEGLEDRLKSLSFLQYSDVVVIGNNDSNLPSEQFMIYTGHQVGNISLTADSSDLLCDPLVLPEVPEPDYKYALPDCLTEDDMTLMYKGALLCRPGDKYDEEPRIPVEVSDAANVSTIYNIDRDLIDPRLEVNGAKPTIKMIAVSKRYNTESYTPYLKNGTTLEKVSYGYTPKNKDTIILIENGLNMNAVMRQLNATTILPSRR